MTAPNLPQPESCAWCDVPQREHCQRWHPTAGWHGYAPPSKALIEARMRRRFQWAGKLPTWPEDPAFCGLELDR